MHMKGVRIVVALPCQGMERVSCWLGMEETSLGQGGIHGCGNGGTQDWFPPGLHTEAEGHAHPKAPTWTA